MGNACARDPVVIAAQPADAHVDNSQSSSSGTAPGTQRWRASQRGVGEDTDGNGDSTSLGVEDIQSDRSNSEPQRKGKTEVVRTQMSRLSSSRRQSIFSRGAVDMTDFFVYKAPKQEVHWLTLVVGHMWEYVEAAIAKLLKVDLTKQIQDDCADIPLMGNFCFTECNFGPKRPAFGPMTVRQKDEFIELIIDMDWIATDSLIEISLGSALTLGMKDLRLKGPLLITLSPLMNILPILGGVGVTFIDVPELTWEWTGIGKAIPVDDLKPRIGASLFRTLVVPSRKFTDIAGLEAMETDAGCKAMPRVVDYQSPPPVGVLRVQVLEGKQLISCDLNGASDPYVTIRVGSCTNSTCVLERTLDPVWGPSHSFDFIVYHLEQHVFVDVYDKDMVGDDPMGYVVMQESRGGKALNRPTVSEVLDSASDWWSLSLPECTLESKLQLKFSFRMVDQDINLVLPLHVDCAEGHGLVAVADGKPKTTLTKCSLCQEKIAMSCYSCVCGGEKFDAGNECRLCNFRVCSSCAVRARPAAGLVRVCFKRGFVPLEDMTAGVVLGLTFEGETLWTNSSYTPYVAPEALDAELCSAVGKLCLKAHIDQLVVARCMGMSASKVAEIVEKARQSAQKSSQSSSQHVSHVMADKVEVVWDHALHFLVRCPDVNEFTATLTYQSDKHKVERVISLQKGKVVDRGKLSKDAGGDDYADSTAVFETKTNWEIHDDERSKSVTIGVEVCFYGLDDDI